MKMHAENNELIITEAFSGVGFKTEDGEHLGVCMRDGGYEISVIEDGKLIWYSIHNGIITKQRGKPDPTVEAPDNLLVTEGYGMPPKEPCITKFKNLPLLTRFLYNDSIFKKCDIDQAHAEGYPESERFDGNELVQVIKEKTDA